MKIPKGMDHEVTVIKRMEAPEPCEVTRILAGKHRSGTEEGGKEQIVRWDRHLMWLSRKAMCDSSGDSIAVVHS